MKEIKKTLLVLAVIASTFLFNLNVDASTKINVSSVNSTNVGTTFKVSVNVGSTENFVKYQYTLNYDTTKLELVTGAPTTIWNDKETKSSTKTFKFKATNKGNSLITVKNYSVTNANNKLLSGTDINISGTTIKTIDNKESSNNNLSSLIIGNETLTPTFDKDVTSYNVDLKSSSKTLKITAKPENNKSKIEGTGEIKINEGLNTLNVIVTSENGKKKTYVITVNAPEANPIKVIINNKTYTVIKNKETIENLCPKGYSIKTIKIDNQEVPVFYNDLTRITLVVLKDENNKQKLFIYNNNKYTHYNKITFETINFLPLEVEKKLIPDGYKQTTTNIFNKKQKVYKNTSNPKYYLIYGMNLNNGKKGWYTYEPTEQTLQKYYSLKIEDEDNIIIIVLGSILIIILIINVIALSKKVSKNKKRKDMLN